MASSPNNKEGHKLDIVGRRMYSLVSFVLRVANYSATIGTYRHHLWNLELPVLEVAPEDVRAQGLSFHQEAMLLARQECIAAQRNVDAVSKQLATAISLRRHG